MPFQQGLLATPVPAHARHLFFTLQSPEALPAALDALLPQVDGEQLLLGIGAPLVKAMGRDVPGLRAFPLLDAAVENPAPNTPCGCGCVATNVATCCCVPRRSSRRWHRHCAWPTALMVSCTVAATT